MKLHVIVMLMLLTFTFTGCGRGDDAESLEAFRQQWFEAVNEQDGQALYDKLDAASKRWISRELDELRGLDPATQQRVIDQLGGQQADTMREMTPGEYFGLLWRLATAGRRPTMQIEAAGGQTAYITLSLPDTQPQRVRLTVEGGQWVWQLPQAQFSVRETSQKEAEASPANDAGVSPAATRSP